MWSVITQPSGNVPRLGTRAGLRAPVPVPAACDGGGGGGGAAAAAAAAAAAGGGGGGGGAAAAVGGGCFLSSRPTPTTL